MKEWTCASSPPFHIAERWLALSLFWKIERQHELADTIEKRLTETLTELSVQQREQTERLTAEVEVLKEEKGFWARLRGR